VIDMRASLVVLVLIVLWVASAFVSGRIAARKNRGVRRWFVLGLVLGPFALIAQSLYPARYSPETTPCPQCGKPLAVRAVACQHCQYRFPAVDVMITRAPSDAESRRALLSEVAREYGIAYADATRLLDTLPVAGFRHVMPDQVSEYVRRLEAVGATVAVVPTPADQLRK
jgi:zinc ribbon protein